MKSQAILCATIVSLMAVGFADAQAPGKATGNYDFWNAMGWQQHAQTQARSLYYYGQTPQPTPTQATEHATAVRTSVKAAQKSLTEIKKSNPDNKEAQAAIAKIEEIQKKVLGHCDMCDKAIAKGDHVDTCGCCANMFHDLESANGEMLKLQKALKIPNPELPQK